MSLGSQSLDWGKDRGGLGSHWVVSLWTGGRIEEGWVISLWTGGRIEEGWVVSLWTEEG